MTVMMREIAEQPAAVDATWRSLRQQRGPLRGLLGGCRHVLFVARGSSDNAAIYGRYLLESLGLLQAALAAPSIATHYRNRIDLSDTCVVSVSQSGETEEIVRTQAWAAECGAATVAVTNDAGSALARSSDLALVTQAGAERAVPATKSYTTQLVAMIAVASAAAPDSAPLESAVERAPGQMQKLIDDRAGIDQAVEVLAGSEQTLVSGRGLALGTAMEIALKLEETCLRPVRGLSYADLRHGPIAVVDPGLAAIVVAARDGPMLTGMNDLAVDLRSRGAAVIAIGGSSRFGAGGVVVPGPDLPEPVAPLGLVLPGQLIVESLAGHLGLDPDAPRGLAKVTMTDPTTGGQE